MRHGAIVDIVGDGHLLLPSRSMELLGIHDRSECWATFVQGENALPFDVKPNEEDFPFRFAQLIVSPVHPSLWPTTFLLTMELDDEPGTLSRATRVLSDLGINLHTVDASPSAFKQVTMVALASHRELTAAVMGSAEVRRADARVGELARRFARAASDTSAGRELDEARRELAKAIGRGLLPGLAALEAGIVAAEAELFDADETSGFFRSRVVEYGDRPYFLSAEEARRLSMGEVQGMPWWTGRAPEAFKRAKGRQFTDRRTAAKEKVLVDSAIQAAKSKDDLDAWLRARMEELVDRHRMRPIRITAAGPLAHAWMWRIRCPRVDPGVRPASKDSDFFKAEYLSSEKLSISGESISSRLLRFHARRHMKFTNAIVSFDRQNAMLRVRFLRAESLRRRAVRVRVDYREQADSSASAARKDGLPIESMGVLHRLAALAFDAGFDLLRVSNRTLTSSAEEEQGQVRLVMVHAEPADLLRRLRDFRERLGVVVADSTVRIERFGWPVVVSLPSDADPDVREGVALASAICGAERPDILLSVVDRGDPLEVDVGEEFSRMPAYGLVQILTLPSSRPVRHLDEVMDEALEEADEELGRRRDSCLVARLALHPFSLEQAMPSQHPIMIDEELEHAAGPLNDDADAAMRQVARATISVVLRLAEQVRARVRTPAG